MLNTTSKKYADNAVVSLESALFPFGFWAKFWANFLSLKYLHHSTPLPPFLFRFSRLYLGYEGKVTIRTKMKAVNKFSTGGYGYAHQEN